MFFAFVFSAQHSESNLREVATGSIQMNDAAMTATGEAIITDELQAARGSASSSLAQLLVH